MSEQATTAREEYGGYVAHPAADRFPLIEGAAFDELVQDMRAHGQRVPAVVWTTGNETLLIDGRNRARAALEAGVEFLTRERVFTDDEDVYAYVWSRNVMRRHLSTGARAMLAARMVTASVGRPGTRGTSLGIDQAASVTGLGRRTVQRGRTVLTRGVDELADAVEDDSVSLRAAADIAQLPPERQREVLTSLDDGQVLERAKEIRNAATRAAMTSSKSNEHYTPAHIMRRVRTFLGGIELDLASCEEANAVVQAERYYSIEDDALTQSWKCRSAFNNPPYGATTVVWTERLAAAFEDGTVGEAVQLLNAHIGTVWLARLMAKYPVCFPLRRLRHRVPGGGLGIAPMHGAVVVGFTRNPQGFADAFRDVGPVIDLATGKSWSCTTPLDGYYAKFEKEYSRPSS